MGTNGTIALMKRIVIAVMAFVMLCLPSSAQGSLKLFFVRSPSDLTVNGAPIDSSVKKISLAQTQGVVYAVNYHGTSTDTMGNSSVHLRVCQGSEDEDNYMMPYPHEKQLSAWDVPCNPKANFVVVPLKFTWAGCFNVYMKTSTQEFWGKIKVAP